MSVTSIQEIKKNQAIEITLPGWGIKDNFVCKLQRVDLLNLASKGKIPNPLIGTVIELFKGKAIGTDNIENFKTLNEATEFFCEVCLVEPTFKELTDAGITLTDDQKMIIYHFALEGPNALLPFLKEPSDSVIGEYGGNVSGKTEPNNEDRG